MKSADSQPMNKYRQVRRWYLTVINKKNSLSGFQAPEGGAELNYDCQRWAGGRIDGQSNYEAAVLDFLDKEMAGTQSTMTENKQSEELDALVADLLHQVMTESDQPQASGEMMSSSEDMNDLLAEFMPQQETVSLPEPGNAPQVPDSLQAESNACG